MGGFMMNFVCDKERFLGIARDKIKRPGIETILKYLEEKTDFFTAPASTRFHDAEPGGLLKHTLKVYDTLSIEGVPYSDETIAIVALFHDLCKVNFYKTEMRNTKDANGKWIQVPYYTVEDKLPYGHGEKSVYMLRECMNLSLEEVMAIRWHMGGFEGERVWNTVSQAFDDFPLALYLHIADLKATHLK